MAGMMTSITLTNHTTQRASNAAPSRHRCCASMTKTPIAANVSAMFSRVRSPTTSIAQSKRLFLVSTAYRPNDTAGTAKAMWWKS